ncbi:hypothetical protein F5146DRAFT_1133770 [Armillaria mellea]|nr:hypothetical protein F5146DRAFT_1133770 [Armillaria mellea]
MDNWELPMSEICLWTYTLIQAFGFDMVVTFRNRALEGPLDERGMARLAYEGEKHHVAVSDRVMAWRESITVVPNHTPPIHPFDSHRRVFSFFNDEPYTPGEAPDDAPTLEALARQYDRWFLLTLLGKFRYDDRKASEGRNDFRGGQTNERTQHRRASRDEPTNTIYDNTASISPSALTMTVPGQSYPPPQHQHQLQAYPASPTSQTPTLGLAAGSPRPFDGLALIALYEQERKLWASDAKR